MRRWTSGRCAVIFLVALLTSLVGCVTRKAATRSLEIGTLYSNAVCDSGAENVGATWLDSPSAFAAAYRRLTRFRLNAGAPPAVDFDGHGVLLVEMGRQNTGGYGLSLFSPRLKMAGDLAQVRVAWSEPHAGVIVTQVITSPCLLLEVPRPGVSAIQVVDQAGRVRATVKVGKR